MAFRGALAGCFLSTTGTGKASVVLITPFHAAEAKCLPATFCLNDNSSEYSPCSTGNEFNLEIVFTHHHTIADHS